MDNLKGIIFQGCPQWSFQFMQGFLSSGTLGFYCTKNIYKPHLYSLFSHTTFHPLLSIRNSQHASSGEKRLKENT
jgi:hypothetical protein